MGDAVNLYDAKTRLSQLVDRAAAGEEIVIAKNGIPQARLMPLAPAPKREIPFGLFREEIRIGSDFDDPLPDDIMAAFEGRGPDFD